MGGAFPLVVRLLRRSDGPDVDGWMIDDGKSTIGVSFGCVVGDLFVGLLN